MLKDILSAHMRVESTIRYARDGVYRPGINAVIKEHVQKCETCQSVHQRQQKETLQLTSVPTLPWSTVRADFLHFGENLLLKTDYYSNFWEIDQLRSTLSSTVSSALKKQFARYGITAIPRKDNNPQIASAEFRKFAQEWKF